MDAKRKRKDGWNPLPEDSLSPTIPLPDWQSRDRYRANGNRLYLVVFQPIRVGIFTGDENQYEYRIIIARINNPGTPFLLHGKN